MLISLPSIGASELDDYREIKERSLERHGLFIAEGEFVVRRLLASGFGIKSVLLAEKAVAEISPLVPAGVPIYVLPGGAVSEVVGFKFHSGIIACGVIPPRRELASVIPKTGPARLVVLPEIAASDNLGTLIRLSAGLGADAVIIGQRCTSPWMRRTVRVSMGSIFRLPIVQSDDIDADLARLKSEHDITLVATVLQPDAEVLGANVLPDRLGVLFGTEGPGLTPTEIAACQRKVTIPMSLGVDSLNVGISAAVILWELFKRPRPSIGAVT